MVHCGICRQGYRGNNPPLFHMCWLTEVRLKSPEIDGDLANVTMRRREHSCTECVCVCVCLYVCGHLTSNKYEANTTYDTNLAVYLKVYGQAN